MKAWTLQRAFWGAWCVGGGGWISPNKIVPKGHSFKSRILMLSDQHFVDIRTQQFFSTLFFIKDRFLFLSRSSSNKNQKYVWPRHLYWGKRTVGVSFYIAVRQLWDWRLQTRFKTRLQTRFKIGSEGRRNRVWNRVYKRVWNRQFRHSKIVVRCLFSDSDMS